MQPGPLNPASLPPGTHVGPWRIVDLRGWGAYGSVYLAQGVAPQATGDVALKLALKPGDERFAREVELLSRVRHPCIPRLIDQGQWQSPFGLSHPYFVMEWIEGIPLYEWAGACAPSSWQVLGVLAGLARALEAIHAVGVHRDVKGDNVLVRLKDGQVFLTDFGSSKYQGAAPLTDQVFPPGTQPYRSPEAYQFALNIRTAPVKVYAPGPADDLFALGVTAYRMVTGQYPPEPQPLDPEYHVWSPEGPGPRPARELNPSCSPGLSAVISRMLSVHPEARGSAREVAEALEQAMRESRLDADAPLFLRKAPRPVQAEEVPKPETPDAGLQRSLRPLQPGDTGATPRSIPADAPQGGLLPRLAAAVAMVSVALGAIWLLDTLGREEPAQEEAGDAGTVAVGDSALTARAEPHHVFSGWPAIALDMPSKPLQGQVRPDANGRCPRGNHIPINGGCWVRVYVVPKDCPRDGYVYKDGCYEPAFPPPRPATSDPIEAPDAGG